MNYGPGTGNSFRLCRDIHVALFRPKFNRMIVMN